MQPAYGDDSRGEARRQAARTAPNRPAIVYIGPSKGFSDCLVRNLTYEFPEFDFRQVADISDARRWRAENDNETQLVIVDDTLCDALLGEFDEFGRLFPNQVICISFNRHEPPENCTSEVFVSGGVRSFLPMNLRLDIWLSAIRLMLNGGDYCPPEVLDLIVKRVEKDAPAPKPARRKPAAVTTASGRGRKLTAREVQVMELASQGFQNKSIAEELGLSEHTVKLHMHNIISKLGATNRTEASGIFLHHYASKTPDGPAPE